MQSFEYEVIFLRPIWTFSKESCIISLSLSFLIYKLTNNNTYLIGLYRRVNNVKFVKGPLQTNRIIHYMFIPPFYQYCFWYCFCYPCLYFPSHVLRNFVLKHNRNSLKGLVGLQFFAFHLHLREDFSKSLASWSRYLHIQMTWETSV